MKAIFTRNYSGTCSAHDGDGNRFRESSTGLSDYEDGHRAALVGLCRKMGWTGQYQGAHVVKGGVNKGMVWSPVDTKYSIDVTSKGA